MKKNFGFGFWFSSFFFVFFSQACRFANAHEKIQFKFNWNPIEIQKNPIEIQSKSKKIQKKKQIEKTIQKKESKKNQKQIEKKIQTKSKKIEKIQTFLISLEWFFVFN